jgi:hypothetical protein
MSKERQPAQRPPAPETSAPESAITLEGLALRVEQLAEAVAHLSRLTPSPEVQNEPVASGAAGELVAGQAEEQDDSIIVKAGSKTYFFDLKQTRDHKPYLLITESRFKGEGEERERVSISVFPETAAAFGQAVAGMVTRLGEPATGRE